jgi:hypothetical protein
MTGVEMEYMIEVTEILQRVVPITADTEESALTAVKQRYKNEDIVLDSADFKGVNFSIVKMGQLP